MDASELLPAPPFDFEKEPLVESSVELDAEKLKGTVQWLIDCIRQQQKHLQSHDLVLNTLKAETGSDSTSVPQPTVNETDSMPRIHKSVSKELQATMDVELLGMQLAKMQHELNALSQVGDVDRQRESILAEVTVLSQKADQRAKDIEDKLHSELGLATSELHERLQRIGDDMLQRLTALENRTTQAEASADQVKDALTSVEERFHVRIESLQVAPQLGGPWKDDDTLEGGDSTLIGTSRTLPEMHSVDDLPEMQSVEKVRDLPSPRERTESIDVATQTSVDEETQTKPATPAQAEGPPAAERPPSTDASQPIANDKSLMDVFATLSELGVAQGVSKQTTLKLEEQLENVVKSIDDLRLRCQGSEEKTKSLDTDMTVLRDYVAQIADGGSEVDALRKEWLGRAANRTGVSRERKRSDESSSKQSSAADEMENSGAGAAPSVVPSAELDAVKTKVDKLEHRFNALQNDIAPRFGILDDAVKELHGILLPEGGPPLGITVANAKTAIADLQKASKDVDRRLRNIAPLDSQFSDVQSELERFRKLFEFVEKVLPPDASKAMSWFNKHEDEKDASLDKQKRKSITPQPPLSTKESQLLNVTAGTLGHEVALEQQREKLVEEVRSYEERMASEFGNLATAIKALQRDMQHTTGKTGDMLDRITRMESRRIVASAEAAIPVPVAPEHKDGIETKPEQTRQTQVDSQVAVGTDQPVSKQDRSLTEAEYVSKKGMKEAMEAMKDDVRNWLDVLHESLVASLQQKADGSQMNHVLAYLHKLGAADGLSTENFAALAKRALLGRCASCDADIRDTATAYKPPPVSRPPNWPKNHDANLGVMQIRQPMAPGHMIVVPSLSAAAPGKLPKIRDTRAAKEQPKSKVFKTSSQPDLREMRTLEPNSE